MSDEAPARSQEGEGGAESEPQAPLPEGVVVRPACPKDAALYLEMWRGVVAERRFVRTEAVRGSVRSYRRQFRKPVTKDHAKLLAVNGDQVIGVLVIERIGHPVNRHVATLGMAVEQSWRGRGRGAWFASPERATGTRTS